MDLPIVLRYGLIIAIGTLQYFQIDNLPPSNTFGKIAQWKHQNQRLRTKTPRLGRVAHMERIICYNVYIIILLLQILPLVTNKAVKAVLHENQTAQFKAQKAYVYGRSGRQSFSKQIYYK